MKRHAFTLTELLVVIAIISLLAAIIFPVLASVRAKARQTVCVSNLHQIGLSIAMYAQDANDIVPFGGDAVDVNTNTWQAYDSGVYWTQAQQLHHHPLVEVLNPYVGNKNIWHCPVDTGFDTPDFSGSVIFSAHPSAFEQYGNSYGYRTELAFRQVSLSGMIAYDVTPPFAVHGASEIDLLDDLSGTWHGGSNSTSERFNVLMGDGHVKTLTDAQMDATRNLTLDNPALFPIAP